MENSKIINIVGRSNSGKTTIVEKLILAFKEKGYRVSAIKSMCHDFDIDHQGKDSSRYREAGAFSAAITNGKKFAIVSEIDDDLSPIDIAEQYFSKSDFVIMEGYKDGVSPKIEVIGDSTEEPLYLSGIKNIRMIVTDLDIETDLPLYKRENIRGIIAAIEDDVLE